MKLRRMFLPLMWCPFFAAVLLAFPGRAQESPEEIPEPYRTFIPEAQKRVAEFPELPVGTKNFAHKPFSIRLDGKPVVVGEHRFDCVRFVAPTDEPRDMIWAFVLPPKYSSWYILPASGKMTGFRNWLNADRLYQDLPATVNNAARLQTLSAASFKTGETYILWFKEEPDFTGPATLAGAINFLPASADKDKKWEPEEIEQALGLKAATAAEQVAYLQSRGGKALLDKRFFSAGYAQGRIDDLLYARRHLRLLQGGWFIKTTIVIPVCNTEPRLADVQAAYGEPDLVLSGKERRIFDKDAEEDETAYYYDYIVFLVKNKDGQPRIMRVTSEPIDTSTVRARQAGLTWGDMPAQGFRMRIFYRDKKEIARVSFWGESEARLVSGELPKETFQRKNEEDGTSEELQYLGDGNWEERSSYPNGQVERTATLQAHAYQGVLRTFYSDGKPQAEGHYNKGRLDGVLKQWRQTGESRELHYKAGELVREPGGQTK
jgi:hypothetical protein